MWEAIRSGDDVAVAALDDESAAVRRLGNAAHGIMRKAIKLSSEDRKDHEKAVRSMRSYRGSGQPDHATVLDIKVSLTGLSVAECLAYSETQASEGSSGRKVVRPVEALTLAEHETELVRLFREGTTAQRVAILAILKDEANDRRAKAEEQKRQGAELDRRMATILADEAPKQPAVKRGRFTLIEGGANS